MDIREMFLNTGKVNGNTVKHAKKALLPGKKHVRCHDCKRCATCGKFHGVPLEKNRKAYCEEHGK